MDLEKINKLNNRKDYLNLGKKDKLNNRKDLDFNKGPFTLNFVFESHKSVMIFVKSTIYNPYLCSFYFRCDFHQPLTHR